MGNFSKAKKIISDDIVNCVCMLL